MLLCQGAHETDAAAHTHALTGGRIKLMASGSGYGDFCGGANGGEAGPLGNNPTVAKAYRVV